MILKLIVSSLCILLVIYGVIKKNRLFFNAGYFVFGIVIVIDQFSLFADNKDIIHLSLASLWMVQVVMTIPNRLPPLTKDGSIVAKTAVPKIMISLSIINFFGAYYATLVDYIPNGAAYGHILLGLLPLFPTYYILADKIDIVDK